jgi:xanthine dehydrogenase accessory factor
VLQTPGSQKGQGPAVRDILSDVLPWYHQGTRFAVATVVATWSSSPRPIGASMAVAQTGEVVGSVSGGCVEGAVYDVGQQVLQTGQPQMVTYGVSDDDAFAVGLTCGGTIQLFVATVDAASFEHLGLIADADAAHQPVAVATVVAGAGDVGRRLVITPEVTYGSLGGNHLDQAVTDDARGMLANGRTGLLQLGSDGERRVEELSVFVESYAPSPKMIVFGAIDFAAAMARMGKFLGYHVTVCDARPVFATRKRFPDVDEVVVAWPHKYLEQVEVDERTVLCVLTHDPKFDVPLLALALRTKAGYIGAMGSRRTHQDRLARLAEIGMSPQELARLSSPIGLDLGARTPEETAVSIAAEIIARMWGGTGQPLTSMTAPIHGKTLSSAARP